MNVGEEHQKLSDLQQFQSTQLIKHLFKPVIPINPSKLDQLLQDHPNRRLVEEVVMGFQKGFPLKFNGLRVNRQPRNLPTAFSYLEKLWDSVMKEVKLGRMLGPFPVQPIDPLICNPVGLVEKKNSTDMLRITHLSHPQGASINSFINPEDCKINYQTLDMALKLVAKHGQGCFMVKEDFKLAFCNVPICFNDLSLLEIKVQGQFFIDCCLSFGAAVSCQVFEKLAMLIH